MEVEQKAELEAFIKRNEIEYVELSNQVGDSVFDVKKKACDILLKYRMSNEERNIAKNAGLKREEDYLRGVKIFEPAQKRDDKERLPTIPEEILAGKKHVLGRPNMKEMQEEHGGAGVFEFPLQEHFLLENQDWKYDIIPEFMDGKNIADFIDPEIEEKLRLLEEEEDALLAEEGLKMESDTEGTELNPEQAEAYKDFKAKVGEIRVESRQNRNLRVRPKPDAPTLKARLEKKGLEAKKIVDQVQKAQKLRGRKTLRAMLDGELGGENKGEDAMDTEGSNTRDRTRSRSRMVSKSMGRDVSKQRSPTPYDETANKIHVVNQRRVKHKGMIGEGDHRIPNLKPKHLFAGKQDFKRDRR